MFNKKIYQERRRKLKGTMKSGVILFLGHEESPMNFPSNCYRFRQDSHFLYFFGIDVPGCIGIIDIDNDKEYLAGREISTDDVIWMGEQPNTHEFAEKSGVAHTKKLEETASLLSGREIHFLPPYNYRSKAKLEELLNIKQATLNEKASIPLIKAVVALRSVKGDEEIVELDKAGDTGYRMHLKVMQLCKPGVSERELAGIIEGIAISEGAGISYASILSQNGQILHNNDHSQILEKGRLLLTDAGAETNMGYASDYTRTLPVGGKFTDRQREIYQIVYQANSEVKAQSKPGVFYKDMHLLACKVITEGLKSLGLMKGDTEEAVAKGAHSLFMPHGLGHMMGLDVHDMEDVGQEYVGYDDSIRPDTQFGLSNLRLGRKLEKGFVFTDEPGIYFIPALIEKWKKEKVNTEFINFDKLSDYYSFGGIRLEDNLLVTETGNRLLGSRPLPITIEEIEEAMN